MIQLYVAFGIGGRVGRGMPLKLGTGVIIWKFANDILTFFT